MIERGSPLSSEMQDARSNLITRLYLLLWVGVTLAAVVNLPVLDLSGALGDRVRNWAIFTGGLLVGVALTRLRSALR